MNLLSLSADPRGPIAAQVVRNVIQWRAVFGTKAP